MGRVRPCQEFDIPQIATLHRRVWGGVDGSSPVIPEAFFAEVLIHNPCYDEALPSLVYEDHKGEIVGCLGLMPRRMSLNGRPVQVAIGHNFMVEPSSRGLAGVRLLKTFFSGPQELSMTQGNDLSRRIWEGLGGTTALLYSIGWVRPLQPSRYFLSFLGTRGLPAPLVFALRPLCHAVDAIAIHTPANPFRLLVPRVSGDELRPETVLAEFAELVGSRSLRPEYDDRSLPWLLQMLAQKKRLGTFRKVLVQSAGQETLGWYLYYVKSGGIGEVVQIAATNVSIHEVLDHLFYDAWRQGVVALSGQLDPKFMRELVDKNCLLRSGNPWVIYSRNLEMVTAIHRGNAFLSQLEGEWSINL